MIAASLVHCDQEDNNDSDDDCCIYTYRGDRQEQDVVDILPVDNRSTSPLMDYLEMDFDPEPTIGIGSDEEDISLDTTNNQKYNFINIAYIIQTSIIILLFNLIVNH